jgi:type I restriction enzyme R subunit
LRVTQDLIRREETAGAIEIGERRLQWRSKGRADYILLVKATLRTRPVAVALIEAKTENLPPIRGLEQAKLHAAGRHLAVAFAIVSNRHLFVEDDRNSGLTSKPRAFAGFPTPDAQCRRYGTALVFRLDSDTARPQPARYAVGETTRRYYQDAAIRAVLRRLARGEKRALLSPATGAVCLPSVRRDNGWGMPRFR